jgi:Uma2 family endonuclease
MTAINISAFTDKISDRDLEKLCADNPETKFETTKEGKLIVMSPTGSESGRKNSSLLIQVGIWNRQTKLGHRPHGGQLEATSSFRGGEIFDSSTGFKLSNGATRSPDVSWIELSRWQAIPKDLQRKFAPIDPDFVIELMSPTDDLDELRQKMTEYMSCGVKLGWLINPDDKQVEIYRVGKDKEVLNNPHSLSGEELMPELIVDLTEIF